MALWYFLLKGRPYGPVVDEEIKKQIANGQMGAKDLLYREQDTIWREAQSFVDFQHLFVAPATPQKSNAKGSSRTTAKSATAPPAQEARWVLLSRKLDGSGYRQKGPYTEEQISRMLQVGEVTFTDYVWREGLKEWYKILALPDFHKPFVETETVKRQLPPLPTEPDTSDNTQAEVTQVLDNTDTDSDHEWAEITRNLPTPEDHTPQKVAPVAKFPIEKKSEVPPALKSAPVAKVPVTKKVVRRGTTTKQKSTIETAKRTSFMQWLSELRAVKKTTAVLVILLLFISAAMVVILVSTYMDRRKLRIFNTAKYFISSNLGQSNAPKEPNRNRSAEQEIGRLKANAPKVATPDPVAVTKAPPAQILAEERTPPQYVRATVEGSGSDGAALNIQTNASRHFPVKVTFTADGGEVLQFPSLEKSFRISKPEERRMELKRLGLPAGTYQVTAEVGDFKDDVTIAFGTLDGEFRSQLVAYRKQLMYSHNEERYGFYKTAVRLEKEAFRLSQTAASAGNLNSWSSFYKDWRRNFDRIKNPTLDRISRKNQNDYVHAKKWLELKKLRSEIDSEAKRLNRSRMKKQEIDVAKAKDLATGVTKLKEAILQASLFKQ